MTKKSKHFLEGLDRDIQTNLIKGLREEWTHHSTGLEGNSLTLGETAFVLAEGLTIDGKSIKDHNEVIGHGKAIDWALEFIQIEHCELTEQDLFDLHKLVQTEKMTDSMKPYGAWKLENNGTMVRDENDKIVYVEYASPVDTPWLMERWLRGTNDALQRDITELEASTVFASIHTGFTSVHPFFDGNGRMSRILANLPLLRSGLPPIVIRNTNTIRSQYIALLQDVQKELGQFSRKNESIPIPEKSLESLAVFFRSEWQHALDIVKQAHDHQSRRNSPSAPVSKPDTSA